MLLGKVPNCFRTDYLNLKVASGQKYFSGIDVTNSSVVIVSPLSCTQLVAKCDHIRSGLSNPTG